MKKLSVCKFFPFASSNSSVPVRSVWIVSQAGFYKFVELLS